MWEHWKHRPEEPLEEKSEVRGSVRSGNANWGEEVQRCRQNSESKNLLAPQKEENVLANIWPCEA